MLSWNFIYIVYFKFQQNVSNWALFSNAIQLSRTSISFIWYFTVRFCGKTLLNKLLVMQNKAARIITKSQYNASKDPLFSRLTIMKFNDLCKFNLGKYICNTKQTNCHHATHFLQNYGRVADLHNYNTCGNRQLYIDTKRTTLASTNFAQSGPRYWESLLAHIKQLPSKQAFSKQLRDYILSTY